MFTQQVGGPFDVSLTGAVYRLAFRDLPDDLAGPRGTERVTTVGFQVGYSRGETIRVTFNGDFARRRSISRPLRDYDRTFYYASISYVL